MDYSHRRHLGTRVKNSDGTFGEYKWKSFGDAFETAEEFGSGLLNLNILPITSDYKDYKMKFYGIYSKNREEWMIGCQAAALYGLTIVNLLSHIRNP